MGCNGSKQSKQSFVVINRHSAGGQTTTHVQTIDDFRKAVRGPGKFFTSA